MGPCALELEAVRNYPGSQHREQQCTVLQIQHKSTNKIFHLRETLKENFATVIGKQSHFPKAIVPGQTTG